VWILSDKEPDSEAFDQLAISEEGFLVGTFNCYSEELESFLYLISADVSQEMKEITCCDSNGEGLDVQQLKLTSNAVYAVTSSGVYKQDIQ
jgi:hypothetical protein